MNVHVGAVGHAWIKLQTERPHVCSRCGAICRAEVRGMASEFAYTPFQRDAAAAKDDAWWAAFRGASREARWLVRLAECPRCQARGPAALRRVRREAAGLGVLVAVLTAAAGGLAVHSAPAAAVLVIVAGTAGALAGVRHLKRVLQRADTDVRLVIEA